MVANQSKRTSVHIVNNNNNDFAIEGPWILKRGLGEDHSHISTVKMQSILRSIGESVNFDLVCVGLVLHDEFTIDGLNLFATKMSEKNYLLSDLISSLHTINNWSIVGQHSDDGLPPNVDCKTLLVKRENILDKRS